MVKPDLSVIEPAHVRAPAPVNVSTVEADASMLAHAGDVPMVTVPVPLLASKNTASDVDGTDAPPPPPVVADQLVVVALFHVPDPPTQNLFATEAS